MKLTLYEDFGAKEGAFYDMQAFNPYQSNTTLISKLVNYSELKIS